MNMTHRIIKWAQKRGLLQDPNSWLVRHFFTPVNSGVNVTETSALNSATVFRAVNLLAGTIASLPLPVYRRLEPRGKERATDHPIYRLLHDRPNPYMTSFQFRQTGVAHQLLWGNWYAEIEFERGRPVALWPIPPWKVEPQWTNFGNIVYEVSLPDGTKRDIPSQYMIHVKNLSINGLKGISCISAGREAVGLALAAEEFAARFFSNGANMGGVLEHPGSLSETAFTNLSNEMDMKYSGLGRAHRLMLLEEGMKYQRVGIPPADGQMLESRKFQVAEIGRLFGITQLHKLGDLDKSSFNNIEHQGIEFVTDTLRPLCVNIEQEFNFKLFNPEVDSQYFTEFLLDGLLRGDIKSRYEAYAIGRQWGWHSANDILELENQNPIGPEGDIYLIPMNMMPAEHALMLPQEPDPEPEPDPEDNRSIEQRNLQAQGRSRAAKSFEPVFKAAAQKVVSREVSNVRKALKKHMGDRSLTSFEQWLEQFYREFPDYIRQQLMPAFIGLSEVMSGLASSEVGSNEQDMRKFTEEYMDAYIARHVGSSQGQLRALAREPEITEEDIDQRLSEWEERRANKIAMNETVQLGNAVARAVFVGAGISLLRWHAIGSETCPYCKEMNGKVMGIDQPFLARDGQLKSEDGHMRINKPTMHPPLHLGCRCIIVPEKG